MKGLPKTATGEVVAFKGWPKLTWFVTEHLGKTPKDFSPSARVTDETSAYIEVSSLPKVCDTKTSSPFLQIGYHIKTIYFI